MAHKFSVSMNEAFQIEAHSFAISKAPVAYTLKSSVSGDFTNDAQDVCSVALGEQCTGGCPRGMYFMCVASGSSASVSVVY